MQQHEKQQTESVLSGQAVGSWLRSTAHFFFSLADSIDGRVQEDAGLMEAAKQACSGLDVQKALVKDANNIILRCCADGATTEDVRTELQHILMLPALSIMTGPLLRQTIPALLDKTPRGKSFDMLHAVRLLAEQYSENNHRELDSHYFNGILSGFAHDLGPRFSPEVLRDYHEIIRNVPSAENQRRSLYMNGLAAYFREVLEPDQCSTMLRDLKRIATHLGKANHEIPAHSEYCAASIFSLLPTTRSVGADASLKIVRIFADVCDLFAATEQKLGSELELAKKNTASLLASLDDQPSVLAAEADRWFDELEESAELVEPITVAMTAATFGSNAWQRASEMARFGLYAADGKPAAHDMLLNQLEDLVQAGDVRRFACLVLNLESMLQADSAVLNEEFFSFYLDESILISLSKIKPLTPDQQKGFENILARGLTHQTVAYKEENYRNVVLNAFREGQSA